MIQKNVKVRVKESHAVGSSDDTIKKSYAVRSSDDDSSFNDDESDYVDE